MKRIFFGVLFITSSLFAVEVVPSVVNGRIPPECRLFTQTSWSTLIDAVRSSDGATVACYPNRYGWNYAQLRHEYQSNNTGAFADSRFPSGYACSGGGFLLGPYGLGLSCPEGETLNSETCTCEAPPTCEPPLVLDDTNTSCVVLTCEQPELLSTDGTYCYVPTCGSNSSYNYTINLCECNTGYVNTTVPGEDSWCQPDTDGDGLGDITADPYPSDADNDGIPDSVDSSPNTPSTTPPAPVADKCTKYPTSLSNYGWNNLGEHGVRCNLNNFNEIYDGSNTYFSDTDDTACAPECLVFFTQCVYPKTYSHASRSCVASSDAGKECVPDPSTTMVVKRGDVCYNQTSCFDTGLVSSSDLVDCPDADSDGTPDNNITIEGTQEAVLGALIKHGAATTFKQEELIEQSKISNTKLAEIEISTKKNGTLLGNIDAKIKANGTLNHTDLSKIDTSIKAMNDSLLDPNRLANSMNLATTANGIEEVKDKLDEIKGLLEAETDIPDQSDSIAAMNGLVSDSQGVFDGLYTDLDNAMGEVSDKIGLVQNGFNITATKSVVTTCPIIRDFDTGERIIPVPLDICKVTNTFYPAGYMLSYGAVLFASVGFFLLILLGGV